MKDEVIRKAEAYLHGIVVFDERDVAITEKQDTIEVRYKECGVDLPISESVVKNAAKYLIGAAVCRDAQQTGRYLYSGAIID